jgi:hypothetical protein
MSQYLGLVDANGSHRASKVLMPIVGESTSTYDAILPFLLRVVVPNASTNILVAAPCALRVIDCWAIAAANGAAGDLVGVLNGATPVITALDLSGADNAIVRAADIDDAADEFAAGATITVDPTSATNCSCQLYIKCMPV